MTSWLHEQRLEAVRKVIRDRPVRAVIDLGCGDGDLMVRLVAERQIERIVGLDLCRASLLRLRGRLEALDKDGTTQIDLVHRSITASSAAFAGFDCAILIETIEHIEPNRLSALERSVFATMRPPTVVITTPNAEFNPLLGVPLHRFRHPDHRFEWGRARFRRWACAIALRNGYKATCQDIAGDHPALGGASQMAVFDLVTSSSDPIAA